MIKWSQEQEERLRYLNDKGLPYSAIAAEFKVSRSAVAGKINRMGLARGAGDGMARRLAALQIASQNRASIWTADMDAALRQVIKDGGTSRDAERIIGVSRSTACGRAKRLGLTWVRPSGGSLLQRQPGALKTPKAKKDNRPREVQADEAARLFLQPPPADAIPLVGRPFGSCAFPVGTPESPGNQLCCGRPAREGSRFQYCDAHLQVAFRSGTAMPERDASRIAGVGSIRATVRREFTKSDPWAMAA